MLGRGGGGISRQALVPYWPGVSERAPLTSSALTSAALGCAQPATSAQNCRASAAAPALRGQAMLVPPMKQ